MSAFKPVLAFDTDEPGFARGFEAGRIWTLLQEDPDAVVGQPFHAANAEMVLRMVEALDLPLRAEFTDDETWMVLS